MAAQLNAAAGESVYLGPPKKPTDPEEKKEDETSKTEHPPRTEDQHHAFP